MYTFERDKHGTLLNCRYRVLHVTGVFASSATRQTPSDDKAERQEQQEHDGSVPQQAARLRGGFDSYVLFHCLTVTSPVNHIQQACW